jgi:WD40 repeat protein
MQFTGTLAAVNTALGTLSFKPLANFSGASGVSLTTSDLGNTGAGGGRTAFVFTVCLYHRMGATPCRWPPIDDSLCGRHSMVAGATDGSLDIFDASGVRLVSLPTSESRVHPMLALSADAERIAVALSDGSVELRETRNPTQRRRLPHAGAIFSLEFSADGQRLLAGDAQGIVTLIDWTDLQETRLRGHVGFVTEPASMPI